MLRIILFVVVISLFGQNLFSSDFELVDVKFKIYNEKYSHLDFFDKNIPEISTNQIFSINPSYEWLNPVFEFRNKSESYKEIIVYKRYYNITHNRLVGGQTFFVSLNDSIGKYSYRKAEYYDSLHNSITPPFGNEGFRIPSKSLIKIYTNQSFNDLFDFFYGITTLKIYFAEYEEGNNFNDYNFDSLSIEFNVCGNNSWKTKDFPYNNFESYFIDPDTARRISSSFPDNRLFASKGAEIVNSADFCYNGYGTYDIEKAIISRDTTIPIGFIESYTEKLIDKERPIFRLNRLNRFQQEHGNLGERYGDTLQTGLLYLENKKDMEFVIQCQRTGKLNNDYSRNWAEKYLYGPEHRVIHNGNCDDEFREPDKLIVEFAFSKDKFELLQPHDSIWNRAIIDGNFIQTEPALTLFGGGGYSSGLPSNLDTSLGLHCDIYDTGKDFNFKSYRIPIPDYMTNEATGGFMRIRLRVDAQKHGNGNIKDDADDFFIQNLYIHDIHTEQDIYIENRQLLLPYTILHKFDFYRKKLISLALFNKNYESSSTRMNYFFNMKSLHQVSRDDYESFSPPFLFGTNYPRSISGFSTTLDTLQTIEPLLFFRDDITQFSIDDVLYYYTYDFIGFKLGSFANSDDIHENNLVIQKDEINVGNVFAYDNPTPTNDVELENTDDIIGLSLCGANSGDFNSDTTYGIRSENCTGQIAVYFPDFYRNIYGFQAYFPNTENAPDSIRFAIYSNSENNLPGEIIDESVITRRIDYNDLTEEEQKSGYITYLYGAETDDNNLSFPIEDRQKIWIAIAQLDEQPLNIGASGYRMGMQIMNYDDSTNGENGNSVLIHNCWNKFLSTTNQEQSINFCAYENELGSGNWKAFTPAKGNPAYAFSNNKGTIKGYNTFTRGSFIPMIRLYTDGSHYQAPINVEGNSPDNNFKLAPNPASEYIVIKYNDHRVSPMVQDIGIEIVNVFGMRVYSSLMPSSGVQQIGINHLAPGFYYINISGHDFQTSRKLIIHR